MPIVYLPTETAKITENRPKVKLFARLKPCGSVLNLHVVFTNKSGKIKLE